MLQPTAVVRWDTPFPSGCSHDVLTRVPDVAWGSGLVLGDFRRPEGLRGRVLIDPTASGGTVGRMSTRRSLKQSGSQLDAAWHALESREVIDLLGRLGTNELWRFTGTAHQRPQPTTLFGQSW